MHAGAAAAGQLEAGMLANPYHFRQQQIAVKRLVFTGQYADCAAQIENFAEFHAMMLRAEVMIYIARWSDFFQTKV
jgi:hypothetical protein